MLSPTIIESDERPVLNNGDARSGQIVEDRIRPTLETGYTVKSPKPVLVIIDETDGATGGGDNSSSFIYKLVQLTQDKPRKKNRASQPNDKRTILRPIIRICNNINASSLQSSLSKLRPHARQLRFQNPADIHTVKRLREICAIENLKAETRALSTLVAVAKGDLRGCLNTLQFIRSRNDEVTETVVCGATEGMKKADNSMTDLYNEWRPFYLDYNSLKRQLKDKTTAHVWNDNDEREFTAKLEKELDKIHQFQRAKTSELARRIADAERDVKTLVAEEESYQAPLSDPESQRRESYPRALDRGSDDDLDSESESESESDNVGGRRESTDGDGDGDGDSFDALQNRFHLLEEQVANLVADVHDLALYTKLNITGFMKILKKHDKQTPLPLKPTFILNYLEQRPFYKYNFDFLILKLSHLYDLVRTRGHPVKGDARMGSRGAICCFSHYVTLRRHDANLTRYKKANEWLMTFDSLPSAMYNDGDFALSPYLTYTLVPFYPLFQERGAPRVERMQEDWDNLQLTRTNEEIYKSLGQCLQVASTRHSGDFRHLGNSPILQLEFAPYINRIVSPQFRLINGHHVRPEERGLMTPLVNVMATLELRFVQERAEDGQLTYRLDPPVDVFVTYDGKRSADISVSRYAVRHLVAQEVDVRLTSRQGDIIEKGQTGKHSNFFSQCTKTSKSVDDDDKPSPTKRARLDAPVHVDIADRPPVDFFGRLIQPSVSARQSKSSNRPNSKAAQSQQKKFRIGYKYKEGNSAAVRKAVKVATFL